MYNSMSIDRLQLAAAHSQNIEQKLFNKIAQKNENEKIWSIKNLNFA